MKLITRDPNGVPIAEFVRLYAEKSVRDSDVISLRRLLRVAALPESWRDYFGERLDGVGGLQ